MKLYVCSRREVVDFVNNFPYFDPLIISITDPKSNPVVFDVPESNVLSLEFHDLEKDYPGHAPAIILFTKEMAMKIKQFLIDKVWKETDNFLLSIWQSKMVLQKIHIIVHCEAGISRSPAVAAALAMHFNKDCSEYFGDASKYIPNRLVYKTLLDCMNGQDNQVPVVRMVNKPDREIF